MKLAELHWPEVARLDRKRSLVSTNTGALLLCEEQKTLDGNVQQGTYKQKPPQARGGELPERRTGLTHRRERIHGRKFFYVMEVTDNKFTATVSTAVASLLVQPTPLHLIGLEVRGSNSTAAFGIRS